MHRYMDEICRKQRNCRIFWPRGDSALSSVCIYLSMYLSVTFQRLVIGQEVSFPSSHWYRKNTTRRDTPGSCSNFNVLTISVDDMDKSYIFGHQKDFSIFVMPDS